MLENACLGLQHTMFYGDGESINKYKKYSQMLVFKGVVHDSAYMSLAGKNCSQ